MPLTPERCIEAITEHSRGLADAVVAGTLRRRVEHCPDWNVADLVWHVTEVHWFWRTITGELLTSPPEEIRRPVRPREEELVEIFLAGTDAIAQTLGAADQSASCWTWYPPQQDVGFVTRHQVQEAIVHHFDAAHAAGRPIEIATDLAVDSIEEFLTVSLADDDDVVRLSETENLELGDDLVLHAIDTGRTWTVTQPPGRALTWAVTDDAPTVSGTAAELLLWLYGRVRLPEAKPNLVLRFRRMAGTD